MNEVFHSDRGGISVAPVRRRRRIAYAVLAAIAAISIAAASFILWPRHTGAQHAAEPTAALAVTITRPVRAIWPVTLEASGAIAAWQEASIGAQVGGYRLVAVLVNVGDQVRKGQVLARFDSAFLRADNERLAAGVAETTANEQRALRLQTSGAISDRDVLQSVTEAKVAHAQLELNRLQLRYTAVLAPDDGVISARTATLGAVVPVGQELFRLIRQNRLEWRGELTAAQLARVDIGQGVELALPGGGAARAKIRATAPSLSPQSRLGIVYADVAPGGRAKAGMYVDGRVAIGQSEALLVPAASVTIRDGRSYVLKVGATRRVSLRPVTSGRRRGDQVEIVNGVERSDQLVVAGAGFLNDGDLVRVSGVVTVGRSAASP